MTDHSSNIPDLEVTIHATKVVPPAAPTPQEPLYLTNIDQMLVVPVETLFVYAPTGACASECVFSVLEAALAQALVPFHFMAGRFEVDADAGRLRVRCNRAGAGFLVASAEQTVRDLGDLKLMNPAFRKLVPAPPRENISLVEDFLLMVQVTRFKCGGFTVGFRMSHSMCDGTSSALFFRTFSSLARGAPPPPPPDLDRTILKPRSPPSPEFPHLEYFKATDAKTLTNPMPQLDYITKHIPISLPELQALKSTAMRDATVRKCSSFEAAVAHFWQARTRTLEFAPDEVTTLLIAVDFRAKMEPRISPAFCGNTIISAHVSAAAADVATRPLAFCVRLIQEAMARVDDRYVRSAIDWLQVHRGGVPAIGSAKDVLVSAWWKFPFYEHDFGWGRPVHSGPPCGSTPQYALIVADGRDDGGLLLLVSFQRHEMAKFERYIKDIRGEGNM